MEMMTPYFRAIQVSDTVTFVNLIRKGKSCGEERRIRLNFIKNSSSDWGIMLVNEKNETIVNLSTRDSDICKIVTELEGKTLAIAVFHSREQHVYDIYLYGFSRIGC